MAPIQKPKNFSDLYDLLVSVGLSVLPSGRINLFIYEFRHPLVKTAVPADGQIDFSCCCRRRGPRLVSFSLSVNLSTSYDAGSLLRLTAKWGKARQRKSASSLVVLLDFWLFLRMCFSTTLHPRYASFCSHLRLGHLHTWYCLLHIAFWGERGSWGDANASRVLLRILLFALLLQ